MLWENVAERVIMEKQKSNPLLHLEWEENVEAFCSVFFGKSLLTCFMGLEADAMIGLKRKKEKTKSRVKGKLLFVAPR